VSQPLSDSHESEKPTGQAFWRWVFACRARQQLEFHPFHARKYTSA